MFTAKRAKYRVVSDTSDALIILDEGPWDKHPTVTNDVEAVVQDLLPALNGRRLYYIDSLGHMEEVAVRDGKFAGFLMGGQ